MDCQEGILPSKFVFIRSSWYLERLVCKCEVNKSSQLQICFDDTLQKNEITTTVTVMKELQLVKTWDNIRYDLSYVIKQEVTGISKGDAKLEVMKFVNQSCSKKIRILEYWILEYKY